MFVCVNLTRCYMLQHRTYYWVGLWVDNPCTGQPCPPSSNCSTCKERWRWFDGSPLSEEMQMYWTPNKPSGSYQCGLLYIGLRDGDCSWSHGFICKKGMFE